jgi:NAD(P)-dependent dehydrogenase (short-subunit alcohol dehydrogenase family)
LTGAEMDTPQQPLPSGFGFHTTAREAIGGRDLTGKVAIVTGGYSGIGTETTRALAQAGATVIVPARSPDKAVAALAGIPRVELERIDLEDPTSIDGFAERFLASGRPLHILINNAALLGDPRVRDARGYEIAFAVNHLGHFQLTARLWPALQKARGARVVSLSSRGHRFGTVHIDDINFERRPHNEGAAYAQAKTANALLALALDTRGKAHQVRAFSVHPGVITTDLGRFQTAEQLTANMKAFGPRRSPEQGAATSVWCAASHQLDGMGGVYCENVDIAEAVEPSITPTDGARPWILDRDLAERLWTLSEQMTGVRFEL